MAAKTQPEVEQQVEQQKVLISWIAKTRPYKKTNFQSQQVLIVLGVLISMVLVFAGEWMLLAVLAAGVFYYYAVNYTPPGEAEYQITNYGLRAYGRLFAWWEFARWWWAEKLGDRLIGLELRTGLMGRMYIPIGKEKPDDIEQILNKFIMFEKPMETWLDKAGKWMAEKFPLESKI